MIKLLILLPIFLIGCGNNKVPVIDVEFKPYVELFRTYHVLHDKDYFYQISTDINFGYIAQPSTESTILAFCMIGQNYVIVDESHWHKASELQKEQLVFHELGHCELGRHHDDDVLSDGIQVSLMNQYQLPENVYKFYREQYIYELFNPGLWPVKEEMLWLPHYGLKIMTEGPSLRQ